MNQRRRSAIDLRSPSSESLSSAPSPQLSPSSPSPRTLRTNPTRSFDPSVAPFVPAPHRNGHRSTPHFGDLPPMRPAPPAGPGGPGPSAQRQRLRALAETDAGIGLQPLGSNPRRRASPSQVVDLTGDDSEDEPVVTGENIVQRPPRPLIPVPRRAQTPGAAGGGGQGIIIEGQNEFDRVMADIDWTLARRQQQAREIIEADMEDPRRRSVLSPPAPEEPAAPRRRIALGGAVMRRGDRQVNYDAERRRHVQPRALPDVGFAPVDDRPWIHSMGNRFAAMIARVGEGLDFGIDFLNARGQAGPPPGMGVGRAGGQDDLKTIMERVTLPDYPPSTDGFTINFEIDGKADPIMIDDDGAIVTKKDQLKPYLQCANCAEPLLVSSAYRSPDDKVWALRCGHVIDQRCLNTLSTPPDTYYLPVLGEEDNHTTGRGSKRRKTPRKAKNAKAEVYEWTCPVSGCGMPHASEKKDEDWSQKGEEGAFALYV